MVHGTCLYDDEAVLGGGIEEPNEGVHCKVVVDPIRITGEAGRRIERCLPLVGRGQITPNQLLCPTRY